MDTNAAILKYGAKAVYESAHRHMAGDTARGLASVGLSAETMGEVWQIMRDAYDQMSAAERAIEHAQASSKLDDAHDGGDA